MGIGISVLVVFIVLAVILKNIISFWIKLTAFVILAAALAVTIWVCSAQPDMHKPFSINTIEYLFKINKDGSLTTTKQITQTVTKKDSEGNNHD